MSQTIPQAIKTAGTRRVLFVEGGVSDLNAITQDEVAAADNVSCYLTAFGQTADQAAIQDRRYCSSQVFEIPGEKTKSLQVSYTFNLGDSGNDQARLSLAEGTKGTLIRFLQKDESDDTFDAGDWYDAVNVECGEQIVIDGEDNALDRIQQKMFIQSEWAAFKRVVPLPKTEWTVAVTGTPDGGTFTLSVDGVETAPIAYNATHTAVKDAVNALQSVTGVTATSVAGPPIALTFSSAVGLTADGSGLSGGTSPGVTVA